MLSPLTLKALHLISMTAWMAGMFYLPRLYAYHADVLPSSEAAKLFSIMERRLLKIIMTPAMLATFLFGLWLVVTTPGIMTQGWLHAKLLLVLVMAGLHGYLAVCRQKLLMGTNTHSSRFYRILNEAPTLLFVGIVLLVVLKPF
jgi:protoporphyrinogen IX oxidase